MDNKKNQPLDPEKLMKDLTRATEEMYKKNLELAERNKILALLRKIDQIIISHTLKIEQIADQVANAVISETGFRNMAIYLVDKKENYLKPLAVVFTKPSTEINDEIMHAFYNTKIALDDFDNPYIISITDQKLIKVDRLYFAYAKHLSREICDQVQSAFGISYLILHPFSIRNETVGLVVLGIASEDITFPFWQDFISRLPEIISIAIDKALLYNQIQKNNIILKQLDKLKDEFVSIASHELRTPLTAIKNYLWLLLEQEKPNLTPKQKEYLKIAYDSAERLIKLVQNMLTVSRIEGKRLQLNLVPTSFFSVVSQVFDELKINAKEREITMSLTKPEKDYFVNVDREKFHEVIQNLISNALKFTPDKGLIKIDFVVEGNQITVNIFNSGSYINPNQQMLLFKKFGRLSNQPLYNRNETSTGLGLYISKQIIELHKGRITVNSLPELGTTFSVTLPLISGSERV